MIKEELSIEQAWLILNGLPHVGPVSLRRLLDHFNDDPMRIFSASMSELKLINDIGPVIARTIVNWQEHFDLSREVQNMKKHQIDFISCNHKYYPALLKEIYDPPVGLYWKGELFASALNIAIVGSRKCTLYGASIAKRLARELAGRGCCIVSGLARGIDTAAHQGALEGNGKTIAVLGCGLDIIYPPENLDLYKQIAKQGAVVSEFPLGRRADRQTFPMRNRVVSGICQGVVVVESGASGGSMISARFAGEQGRQVFAVPGRIDQSVSKGCHQLIRDGAILVTEVKDIIEEINYAVQTEFNMDSEQPEAPQNHSILNELSGSEFKVYEHLSGGEALCGDSLVKMTDLTIQEVSATLLMLELKSHIVKKADGSYEKTIV